MKRPGFHDQCCYDNTGRCIFCRAKRAKRFAIVALWSVVIALLAGCAGAALPTKPIADARKLVDATDSPVAAVDAGLLAIEPVLIAACTGTAPPLEPAQCGPALKGYNLAATGLRDAQEALVAVDAALATLEAVAEALK